MSLMALLSVSSQLNVFGQLPTGFTQKKLTGDVINEATATVHAPDGRVFIAERSGTVKVFQNGTVTTVHTVSTTTDSEQGLLGITLHPQFASNGKFYIFYTNTQKTVHYLDVVTINPANQVTASGRVMEFDPIINGFHNGGAILFKDGYLYVAIGESNSSAEATKLDTYRGKILRLTEDGQPAPGNPYYNEAGASRQKRSIWAIGMRNPWKMALDPASGKIFVVNVGGNYEEFNDVTNPDAAKSYNYGWDSKGQSGPEQPASTIAPVFYYGHTGWGCAITSGVFFNPSTTNYPAQYRNRFYFSDWCSNWLRSVDATNPGAGYTEFSNTGFDRILGTSVGIDGNLYYIKYGTQGSLWRVEYTNNQNLTIVNQPVSRTVVAGDPVSFAVTASGGGSYTYQWQKNGTNITGATNSTYSIAQTVAADAGAYRCVVGNGSQSVTSSNAQLTVTAPNARPVAHITQPASSLTWSVGDVIRFAGDATDAEDGTLPPSAYRWEARFFHKDNPTSEHWHPGPGLPSGVTSGSFVADNGGETSPNIWFRILLTVTDSQGRTGVDSVDIQPNKVVLTAEATVAGLQLVLGSQATAPFSKTFVTNTLINLQAPSPQTISGTSYAFTAWDNGGAASQSLRVPLTNTTYRATYTATTPPSNTQSPYSGTAVSLPGKVEAENYDLGGEGVAYHDATSNNAGNEYRPNEGVDLEGCAEGGFNIGYVANGEWTEYTVNVTTAGQYTLSARIASPNSPRTFHVELDGQNISGPITVPTTGGYQAWQTVSVTTPPLTTGIKVLRVVMDADNFNLNYLTFALSGSSNPLAVALTSPTTNTTYAAGATLTIAANATGNAVSKVEFFQGSTKLGEDQTEPYAYTWSNVPAGSYALTARATNASGQSITSAPVNITVNAPTPPTGGNVNLALNKPAVASSMERGDLDAKYAVDGKMSTRWSSTFSNPQWIYVDLGASYNISQIKIYWENARGKDFDVQVADVVGQWTTVRSVTSNSALTNDFTGLTARGRYVRMYGTARTTAYGFSIFELEVYGSLPTSRVAALNWPNEVNEEKTYTLYPNPATDALTIDGLTADDDFTIISVGTARTTKLRSENRKLNVSQLTPGLYLLELERASSQPVRIKFIKQ